MLLVLLTVVCVNGGVVVNSDVFSAFFVVTLAIVVFAYALEVVLGGCSELLAVSAILAG